MEETVLAGAGVAGVVDVVVDVTGCDVTGCDDVSVDAGVGEVVGVVVGVGGIVVGMGV